jgi:hypothetical protein
MPVSAAVEAAQLLAESARVTAVEIPPRAGHAAIGAWRAAFPRAELFIEGTPLKATAGLHHPLRHFDAALGVEVHGFPNPGVATAKAQAGDTRQEIEKSLAITDLGSPAPLDQNLPAARTFFTGLGTCSLREPIGALTELGILDE